MAGCTDIGRGDGIELERAGLGRRGRVCRTNVVATLRATLERIAGSTEFIELIERRGTGAIYRDADGFGDYMAASDASFGEAMAAVGLVP